MKNILYTFLFVSLVSCGKVSPKGNIERKNVDVSEFVNLDLEGKFRVFYARGPKNFMEIETYPNVADNLDVDVDDKTLSIKEKRGTKGVDFYNITIYSKYKNAFTLYLYFSIMIDREKERLGGGKGG